jgi:predicted AlkP superfamily pyrophosphatase or phosphodiesterase
MVLPRYSRSTLSDLTPGIGAHLGVPGCDDDPLGLPDSHRYVVVLIDGLGFHLMRRAVREAPYLASLLGDAASITSGVPSTTVTSLSSLGTGLVPGQHGMVGYTSRVPQTGEILNALTWDSDLSARDYQPKPTFFERARDSGVRVSSVALARLEHSGLTQAVLRGAEFVPFQHEHQQERRIALVAAAAQRGERTLVYAYERELDHCGHAYGSASERWLAALGRIDAMCERLREALPDDVRLLITADHGMVDVPTSGQIIAEDEPVLMRGVSALAGEGRFRHVYVDEDCPSAVAERWADRLGELAWVRSRQEAFDEGWFGAVDNRLRERFGHVLVAMRGTSAVMTRQLPRELELVGMHGSLTAAEMVVPLFTD